ncbi:hypothetical protein [Saccharopolyspora rectivirgula]|jgi:hypothetical protein|nr:hypothetical protein [Saccharopolyspora rectivirgula]
MRGRFFGDVLTIFIIPLLLMLLAALGAVLISQGAFVGEIIS